jgi:hypothetical protein
MRHLITSLAAIAAFGSDAAIAQDQEWPRFHVGVAVGESRLDRTLSEASEALAEIWGDKSIDDVTGWKVAAGFRPSRIVGAEIQYVEFGEDEVSDVDGYGAQVFTITAGLDMKASTTAWVASALVFIPERSPTVDVYGKVGIAALDESLEAHHFNYVLGPCIPISACPLNVQDSAVHESDSRPYLGIGARFKVARALGVRVEYEAIDRDTGDDITMLSIGVAFER